MHDTNSTSHSASPISQSWSRWLWLALLLTTALWFTTLGTRRLLNPDEGRYAEIPREMLVTGDWITPRLNGIKYFEKPPLQYWMTASAYQVFGHNEFAARFWVGLTGFAGILLAGFAGWRLFSRSAGLMAAGITAGSVLYLVIGHINTLDMGVSFFLQVTICSFLLAQRAPAASTSERNWMLLAWAAAALAFLSKGLIALILPSLTLLAYTVITREFSAWRRLHIFKGLLVFLALVLPWLIAVSRANPEFLHFFFLHEQFERFLSDVHDRDGPWWYFLPLFVIGGLPWTFVAAGQFNHSWRLDGQQAGLQTRRFLLLWVVVVIGFFSVSHSKLPPYIVPVIPMFAMLVGDVFTRLAASALRTHLLVMGITLALLGITVGLLPDNIAGAKSVDVVINLRPDTATGLLLAAAAMLVASQLLRKRSMEVVVLTASLGMLLGMTILIQGSNGLAATRSGYALAQQLAGKISPDTPVYAVQDYDQTLPFYLERLITLVNYRGELDFGLTQQPELGIDTIEAFTKTWQEQHAAVAVMSPVVYSERLGMGLAMQIIARQPQQLAVSKPSTPQP
jgi:4-amino-4-deoxy-L-arabinose transferase-like glycosyltransferase